MVGKFKLKKINQSHNTLEDISPEVLKMLEDMAEKKKLDINPSQEAHARLPPQRQKSH